MALRRRAIGRMAIALGIAAIVVISAVGILAITSTPPNSTTRPPISTSQNSTLVSASRTSGTWNFTAAINSSSVKQGQYVGLATYLTDTSPSNQTIRNFVEPWVNPAVYAQNGTEVWVWEHPVENWPTWTFQSGKLYSQPVSIPTALLGVGQTYSIQVAPLFQDNLTITLQFSVH